METAKIFQNGQSQAVRLPRRFRFACDRVAIKKVGNAVVLFPPDAPWDTLFNALEQFSPDFMADRCQPQIQERASL
ncbi:type II toxin-antitoxin system VapB family antitoxin [Desulfovibrio sp. ZJ200]|uniref:type II toxin-antitoxin system antitoxin VapB n=1 Tax=Desulfovibrio sp. ZJ200 TaxID=2709792 RepID=UPI0013EA11FF|nr:type II toxin-antitoxin system VapB family antitoxin [Desulfovibrio sp. ZJ200]